LRIENREYGVVLQWLDATVVEHSFELSPAQETEIQRLAGLMQIELDEHRHRPMT
jgi:hypothetical protein